MAEQERDTRGDSHVHDVLDTEEGKGLERVVRISRVAAVVKGGRRFSFTATVVVGNGDGEVGIGYGKAREVPVAVEKALKDGRSKLQKVAVRNGTLPFKVTGRFGAARVVMLPANEGTGVIAGEVVRAVLECAGVKNVLTKSIGSNNKLNLLRAALDGLLQLRSKGDLERLRGVAFEAE
ncbi:MAG TPA: 30S ribosomal protein S5 [Planctomycetes bacterium]|nr:30S ribosomal protein S5 [Planctomycetota bacterium]